jgi:hypothetical protein
LCPPQPPHPALLRKKSPNRADFLLLNPKNKIIFTLKFAVAVSFKRTGFAKPESENADLLLFSPINFLQGPPLPDSTAV